MKLERQQFLEIILSQRKVHVTPAYFHVAREVTKEMRKLSILNGV